MKLTELEINSLLERVRESHFVVLGDFCLDPYFFLDDDFSQISIETGLKTRSFLFLFFKSFVDEIESLMLIEDSMKRPVTIVSGQWR